MRHSISIPVLAAIFTLPAILATVHRGSAADKPATTAAKPAPWYMQDHVQYFQPGSQVPLPARAAAKPPPYPPRGSIFNGPTVPPPLGPAAFPFQLTTPGMADKVKALGERLGQALNRAVDVFSGNEAEFLAKNKTALLSGNEAELASKNKATLLSHNRPSVLNGEKPKVLSENKTAVLSGNKAEGNTMNLFSNIHLFSDIRVEVHTSISGTNAGNTMLNMGEKEKEKPSKTSSATAASNAPPYNYGSGYGYGGTSGYGSTQSTNPYTPYYGVGNTGPSYPSTTTPARSPQSEIQSLRRENEQLKHRLNEMSEQLRQMKEQLGRLQRGGNTISAPPTWPPPSATPSK